MKKALYIVLSRDRDEFIVSTHDYDVASLAKAEQILKEERAGGRPSVYIRTTYLRTKKTTCDENS